MNHKGTVTLETERLILRRFTMADLEPIFRNCWSDLEVWKWTSYDPMNSIDDVLTLNNIFTDFWFAKYEKCNHYNWVIQLKATSEVIGRLTGRNPNDRIEQIELTYEIGRNWWNQGLITEAVKAIIGFFFNDVGVRRIWADHAKENPASGRVMQKCGMLYEGIARQEMVVNAGRFDSVIYAILAEDYYTETIISIRDKPEYYERAVDYFSAKWGIDRKIYEESITDAIKTDKPLPRWYLMLRGDDIIGSYGLIENDFMVRKDLMPWLCALYIEESERGKALGAKLLEHGQQEARKLGFDKVYLCTDHMGYYEKYGWAFFGMEESEFGGDTHVYSIDTVKPVDFWSAINALITSSEVVIDRPRGTKHPCFDVIYPLDYGYLKDTTSTDGGGIDVWRGSIGGDRCDAVICIVDLLKKDSEIKILLGCTEAEKDTILRFHNDSEFMKGVMIRKEKP